MVTYLIRSALYKSEWYLMHVVDNNMYLTRIHDVDMSAWHEIPANVVNTILSEAQYSSADLAYIKNTDYAEWLQHQLDLADDYASREH